MVGLQLMETVVSRAAIGQWLAKLAKSIGNPPWQELTLEEHAFWARFFPGLRGLTQREQEQEKNRLRRARRDLVATYEAEVATTDRLRPGVLSTGCTSPQVCPGQTCQSHAVRAVSS